jgi:prepilin-type N-terminal cleavage/methylation domain-containing protein
VRKRFVDRLHELRATQHGFTLLELLIGVVIVSILAAVATQYFLHQRRKGWVAQVRASTRHMAGAQNYFVFDGGATGFTNDLDDLYLVGYRWDDLSVRPYVALATNQTYCVQVHSAHDPTIVWHFSSNTGYPQEGPATPSDCGDPEALGTYIAGLPPASAGRDGVPSGLGEGGTVASADPSGGTGSGSETPGGDGSTGTGTGTGTTGGTGSTGGTTGTGGTGGTTDPGTGGSTHTGGSGGTDPGSDGSGGTTGSTGTGTNGGSGSCDGGTGGGGSSGSNHPSGKDRDTENGGSGSQGSSGSDPDGDENGGSDQPGQGGGANQGDQDGNNGSGNDTDFEDDNRGPDRDGSGTPGSGC